MVHRVQVQGRQLRLMRIRAAALALLLIGTTRLHAYRVEFITVRGQERIAGSEVCLHRAGDGQGPVAMFFASPDVRCLPADQIIDVPSGAWSFYARHTDGYVSAHGSTLIRRGPRAPDQGYRSVEVDLHPAAYVDFSELETGADRFAAYVPMTEHATYAPAAFPLPAGGTRIAVPAGYAFTIVRIRGGRPVAAGPFVTAKAGETLSAVELVPALSERDLLGWIAIDPESQANMRDVKPPIVRLLDGRKRERSPAFDWDTAGAAHEGLVIFNDVPPGPLTLRLSGPAWRTSERSVPHDPPAGGFLDTPLVARLAQRIAVRWHIPRSSNQPPAECADITKKILPAADWTLKLMACEGPPAQGAIRKPAACQVIRTESVPAGESGSSRFDVSNAGLYAAILESPNTTLGALDIVIKSREDTDVELPLRVPVVFGRVTENDRPVPALIAFETGTAVADATGSYYAVLETDPGDNVVEVIPCDGTDTFSHIPAEVIAGSREYNINIPGNRVHVSVSDADTGKAIPGASIGRGFFATENDARKAETGDDLRADGKGETLLRRLEPGYFLRVCAGAEGYWPRACADPIALQIDTDETIRLSLHRRELRRGRIATNPPLQATTVYRTTAAGHIVEEIRVKSDGSFAYTGTNPADFLVVAGVGHPLFVVPHPAIGDSELVVRVPSGPIRTFTVAISPEMPHRSGWFTIAIGDALLPVNALAAHNTRRGFTTYIEDGGPNRVVEILESAPLRVLAILGTYPQPVSVPDLFLLPQYAPIREFRPVPPDGQVVFGRQ